MGCSPAQEQPLDDKRSLFHRSKYTTWYALLKYRKKNCQKLRHPTTPSSPSHGLACLPAACPTCLEAWLATWRIGCSLPGCLQWLPAWLGCLPGLVGLLNCLAMLAGCIGWLGWLAEPPGWIVWLGWLAGFSGWAGWLALLIGCLC